MSNYNGILIVKLALFPYYTDIKNLPQSSPCSREGFVDTLSGMLSHLTRLCSLPVYPSRDSKAVQCATLAEPGCGAEDEVSIVQ